MISLHKAISPARLSEPDRTYFVYDPNAFCYGYKWSCQLSLNLSFNFQL